MIIFVSAVPMMLGACGGNDGSPDVAGDAAVGSIGVDVGAGRTTDTGGAAAEGGSPDTNSDADSGGSPDGTGLITIDGDDYEFAVEFCVGSTDQLARIAGPGTTPGGEPFWAEVRWGLGGPVATQLGVGIDGVTTERGDPHWQSTADDGAQYVSFDGGLTISYEAPFEQFSKPGEPEVPGSVDASCQMS